MRIVGLLVVPAYKLYSLYDAYRLQKLLGWKENDSFLQERENL